MQSLKQMTSQIASKTKGFEKLPKCLLHECMTLVAIIYDKKLEVIEDGMSAKIINNLLDISKDVCTNNFRFIYQYENELHTYISPLKSRMHNFILSDLSKEKGYCVFKEFVNNLNIVMSDEEKCIMSLPDNIKYNMQIKGNIYYYHMKTYNNTTNIDIHKLIKYFKNATYSNLFDSKYNLTSDDDLASSDDDLASSDDEFTDDVLSDDDEY